MTEAADMSGATRMQKLSNVQLPLALPTMAVGFNQAIMFAFLMVIIAAFIGTQDLGQELQKKLAGTDLGKNFVLGICVSLMALTFGMAIMAWAEKRKSARPLGSKPKPLWCPVKPGAGSSLLHTSRNRFRN